MARNVHAGCIDKDHLPGLLIVLQGEDAHLALAGGLRPGRDRCNFLPQQGVDQRRFANVRTPDYSDKSGSEICIYYHSLHSIKE